MAQTGQISRHFFLPTFEDINAVLEEEPPKRSVFITDFADQVEMNIRSIIQVGHQLAVIGDECNRRYSGKLEDTLFQLAKGSLEKPNLCFPDSVLGQKRREICWEFLGQKLEKDYRLCLACLDSLELGIPEMGAGPPDGSFYLVAA